MRKFMQYLFLLIMLCSIASISYILIDQYYLTPKVADKANVEALKIDKDQIALNKARIQHNQNKNKIIVKDITKPLTNKEIEKLNKKSKNKQSNNQRNTSQQNNSQQNNNQQNDSRQQDLNYQSPNYDSGDPNISYNPNIIRSIDRIPLNSYINPNYKIGEIYIPSVYLHLAIMEGLTNENLNVATGTMKPGQEMGKGNYAIAGHHAYTNILFTPLMKVQKGNIIYITDKETVYEYKITKLKYLSQKDGYVISDSQGDKIITLITCSDPKGSKRYMVRGELINYYNLNKASQKIKNQFQ